MTEWQPAIVKPFEEMLAHNKIVDPTVATLHPDWEARFRALTGKRIAVRPALDAYWAARHSVRSGKT